VKNILAAAGNLTRGIWRRRRDVSYVSLVGYATLLLTLVLQIGIARLLGPSEFGIYSASLAIIALFEVPLVVRSGETAIRLLGERWRTGDGLVPLAMRMVRFDWILFLSTFLVIEAAIWTVRSRVGIDPWLVTILALMIPAQAGYGVYKSYFILLDKVTDMVRYEFTYALALASLNLIGLVGWGLYGLAVSMPVACVAKTYLAYRYTRKYVPEPSDMVAAESRVPSLTKLGFISITRNFFANALNQVDVILLGFLQKPEVVALYRVGKSLASLPTKVSFPVWRYLQPKFMEAIQSGHLARQRQIALSGAAVVLVVIVCLTPAVLIFGEDLLVSLYGEAYRGAFEHFLILSVGVCTFYGISGWFKFWAVLSNAQAFGIGVYATSVVAVVALGASIATLSPVAMAYVMSSVLVIMSAFVFAILLRS
jgi:O-antigen/teichoic acid export membrane protein